MPPTSESEGLSAKPTRLPGGASWERSQWFAQKPRQRAFRLIGDGLPRVILSHIALAKNGPFVEKSVGFNWGDYLFRLSMNNL